jgi:Ca-activated chloride channel family protein
MTFLWQDLLWLLLLIPVLIAAYIWMQRRRSKYALRYASLSVVKEAIGKGPGIRRHIPPFLFLLGLTILLIALARPAATVLLPSNQGTIILSIDVSGSMQAEDMKPNRLEAEKIAARAFIDKQPPSVRIGVVAYSDNAAVVQAPTNDREAILAAINRLTPQRGTAIGRGILTAVDALFEDASQKPTPIPTGRGDALVQPEPTVAPTPYPRGTYAPGIVILMSDGESNVGPRPLDIIDQVKSRGVRVYTIGVGSPEGTVLNIQGRAIRVRLDEETMKKIADATDADYYKADTESDLKKVYENLSTQIIFKPEQTELTAFFAGGAAVFILLAGTLSLLWFSRLP